MVASGNSTLKFIPAQPLAIAPTPIADQLTAAPTLPPAAPPLSAQAPTPLAFPLVHGSRAGNAIALTFDADMTPGMLSQLHNGQVRSWYDASIIQTLDKERVPATFFLTGLWTGAYPDQARALAADPLVELGNHTYDHAAFHTPCYGLWQASDKSAEIQQAQDMIIRATGVTPRLFRFPGDCDAASDVDLVRGLGMTVVSGDVAGADAFNPSPASVTATVLSHAQPGSIVILHCHGGPNAPATGAALAPIIQGLRAKGLKFVTVSELMREDSA
ncbi:MAG TPA: polysaccharide deacetylase family protein [Candidatus Dormibacteraeota bacterium]|nr:polysaccharide deacetylase family protein [Candidatus Dormibacteraeota bacterium]